MQTKQNEKEGKEKRALPRINHSTSFVFGQFYTVREDYVPPEINISLKHYLWNVRRQGPFPKPFHAWIKLQAIFLLLKPLKGNFI